MDEQNPNGLNSLSDEEVDAIAGGWIVDMGEQANDGNLRFAIVDDISGELVGQAADFREARDFALSNPGGARTGKAVITPEQYEEMFGRPLFG